MTINEKLEIISHMENAGFSDTLIEEVVKSFDTPQEVAYICNTPEELTAAIAEMSMEEDPSEND